MIFAEFLLNLFVWCVHPPWPRRQKSDLQPERQGNFLQGAQGRVPRTVLELGKYPGRDVGNFLGIFLLAHAQDLAHPTRRFPNTHITLGEAEIKLLFHPGHYFGGGSFHQGLLCPCPRSYLSKSCGNFIGPARESLNNVIINMAVFHGLLQSFDILTQVGKPGPGLNGG